MAQRAQKLSPDQVDPRNSLQYYTRESVKNSDYWDDKSLRAEYSRLRDIAQKRLKRLAKSESDSYAYRHNVGKYKPARGQSTAELREKLPELAKFIAAKSGSVSGILAQRAAAVETMKEHGYEGITKGNYKLFAQFMREWRAQKLQKVWGSPEVYEMFIFTCENKIPWDKIKDSFESWLAHLEELESYVERQSGEEVTAEMIVKELDRLTEDE